MEKKFSVRTSGWFMALSLIVGLMLAGCGGDSEEAPDSSSVAADTITQEAAKPLPPLEVYTASGWAVPQWTGSPEFDRAMVLYTQRENDAAFAAFTSLDGREAPTGTAMLGRCYEEGRGVAEDSGQALVLYIKAQEAGDALGAYHYYRMTGKEYEDAARQEMIPLMEKAAGDGNVIAKSLLAHWLYNYPDTKNTWLEQDGEEKTSYFDRAVALDTEAAEAGYAPSQNRLAWVSEHFLDNKRAAIRWREMAVKNKFPVLD